MKTIQVYFEHNCETWWDNAREEAKHNPPEACIGLLDSVNDITVDDEDADAFIAWAEQIEGWNEQPFIVTDAANGGATTTTYTIHDYATGKAIGEIYLTAEQYRRYEQNAQQPEGIIEAQYLPGSAEWSDLPTKECPVYLD